MTTFVGRPSSRRMLTVETWPERAACAGRDVEEFYPARETQNRTGLYTPEAARALALCRSCPVVAECLAYGMTEVYGIFGGMTSEERRKLRRRGTR